MPGDMLDRLYGGGQPTGASTGTGGGTQQPAGGGDMLDRMYGNTAAPKKEGLGDTVQGLWDTVNPMPMVNAMTASGKAFNQWVGPAGSFVLPAMGMVQAHQNTAQKAQEAAQHGDYSSATGYGVASALPMVGPAAAKVGEDFADRPYYATGEGIGLLLPFGMGRMMRGASRFLGPALEDSAKMGYARALEPNGLKQRQLAQDVVVPGALKRGITGNSLEDLSDQANTGKQQAGAEIDRQEQIILNNQAGAGPVQIHPVQQFLTFLDDLRNGKGSTQGPTRINGVMVNPVKDAAITKYQNVLREMVKNDPYGGGFNAISEKALLEFRRALDEQIQGQHVVVPGADTPAPMSVTRPLANVLREAFNSTHPDIAQAFADYRFFKTFETMVNRAKTAKTGKTGFSEHMGSLVLGLSDFVQSHNPIQSYAISQAFRMLYNATRSVTWRTTSAMTKHNIATAMANGQFARVTQILENVATVGLTGNMNLKENEQPKRSLFGTGQPTQGQR